MANSQLPGLLKKYKAHGHLAGHDHCMQHIERDGILHVVAGAGSDGWYSYKSISGAQWYISSNNHGSVKGGFAELDISSSGAKMVYYDDKGSVLHTSNVFPPRSYAPTPPAPTPPAPSGSWDCRTDYIAQKGTDTNLKYTGDDLGSCQRECLSTSSCQALYWHKTDSHCHVLTGSFSRDSWSDELNSNEEYDACYLVGLEDLV